MAWINQFTNSIRIIFSTVELFERFRGYLCSFWRCTVDLFHMLLLGTFHRYTVGAPFPLTPERNWSKAECHKKRIKNQLCTSDHRTRPDPKHRSGSKLDSMISFSSGSGHSSIPCEPERKLKMLYNYKPHWYLNPSLTYYTRSTLFQWLPRSWKILELYPATYISFWGFQLWCIKWQEAEIDSFTVTFSLSVEEANRSFCCIVYSYQYAVVSSTGVVVLVLK